MRSSFARFKRTRGSAFSRGVSSRTRFDICRDVARYKAAHDIPMMQPDRVIAVRERYLARGTSVGLPTTFSSDLFEVLIAATCRLEDEIIAALSSAAQEETEHA